MYRILLILYIIWGGVSIASGQDFNYSFTQLSTNQGLSQASVTFVGLQMADEVTGLAAVSTGVVVGAKLLHMVLAEHIDGKGRAGGDGVRGAGLAGGAELHFGGVAACFPGRCGHLFADGLPGLPHLFQILFCHRTQSSSVYFARSPPMSFGRVRAQRMFASPIRFRLSRTGTATRRRCIPIRVPPMSIPA